MRAPCSCRGEMIPASLGPVSGGAFGERRCPNCHGSGHVVDVDGTVGEIYLLAASACDAECDSRYVPAWSDLVCGARALLAVRDLRPMGAAPRGNSRTETCRKVDRQLDDLPSTLDGVRGPLWCCAVALVRDALRRVRPVGA